MNLYGEKKNLCFQNPAPKKKNNSIHIFAMIHGAGMNAENNKF